VFLLLSSLSLIALPLPLTILLSAAFLVALLSPLPWCALLLPFGGAIEESVVPHLAVSHPAHASFYRLCMALVILVTIPSGTTKRQHNRWFIVCFLALALVLSLAATSATNAESLSPAIRGTINNSEGSTLKGARVLVTNQSTEAVFRTRTDNTGNYEFHKLPAGVYSLSVQSPGFQTFTVYGINLTPDSDYTRQIEMVRGSMTRAILVPAKVPPENTQVVRLLPPAQP
jgi:Carboxypeptidase regulatory-like domain